MAGPFDFLQNPKFKQFASESLQDVGYGLANSTNIGGAFGQATNRMAQMQPYRDEQALRASEQAKQAEALNQTTEWLRQNGKDALYAAVQSGAMAPGEAWKVALEEDAAARQGVKPIEINGQLVDPATGQVVGDYRNPTAAPAPIEINGQLVDPITRQVVGDYRTPEQIGGPKLTDAQRKASSLYTVVAPDAELLLGTDGKSGLFDQLGDGGSQFWNGVGAAGVNPMAGLASGNFQSAKDAVTNIAQSYLYAMSGAAAPAEEVKKIADLVTPNPGDSQQRKDEKRRRLQSYVLAVQNSTIPVPMTGNGQSGAGWEVIGVTQ